jgi:hypothetical protein
MVRFFVKRYFHGIATRRVWLLLVFLAPLTYGVLSALTADRFSVTQEIEISKDAPVALASSPIDFTPMSLVVAHPKNFLQDSLALREIYAELYGGMTPDQTDRRYRILTQAVDKDLSLTMVSDGIARMAYYGDDQKVGETLVGSYARRLVERAQTGLARKKQRSFKREFSQQNIQERSSAASSSELVGLKGSMQVDARHALWRSDRLAPFARIFVVSLIAVLFLLGLLEWADPALKSERQIARYLGLPILGSMPDFNKVSEALEGRG